MFRRGCRTFTILVACLVAVLSAADGQTVFRGVDFVNPVLGFSVADQNVQLAAMKAAGIRDIRFGVESDIDKNLDFIKRAYALGIRSDLILHGRFPPGAPMRLYNGKQFPGMNAGVPFSSLDPVLCKEYFQQLMDKLDADGVVLAGLEFENEINMAGYNPDFRLPGEGRVLSLNDLYHDPEGKQVARGFVQYLKGLAALKEVRDQSKLNQHTPLLPTSLVGIVQEGPWPTPKNYDGVSAGATMVFLRANGVDKLVDAYNLHVYPWADGPSTQVSAIHRMRALEQLVQPICSPAGAAGGKPCWVTEWGFMNDSKACPSDEKARTLLVQEMLGDFAQLAKQGRLTGLIYYSWVGEARFDVFRCGSLTATGRVGLAALK